MNPMRCSGTTGTLLALSAAIALAPCGASAAIRFVNAAAAGSDTGASWADAYTSLQTALATAAAGDQIWVAQGIYKPSAAVDVDNSGGTDAREVTFRIPSGVQLYGGFEGNEASLDERDWDVHLTILSGDIDDNDLDADGNGIAEATADIVGANAYHVVFTEAVSAATLLDGFVVTAGKAGDFLPLGFSPNRDGGGWYNREAPAPDTSSPTVRNCRFRGNYADARGGALFLGSFQAGTYQPILVDNEFSGNEALRAGGALYLVGDRALVQGNTFRNNAATLLSMGGETSPGAGGAVFLHASNARFERSLFIANSATGNPTGPYEGGGGGAVYVNHSDPSTDAIGASHPVFVNCGFYGNTAGGNGGGWGGAVVNKSDGGNLRISYIGCVFSGNSATDDGGAMASFARTLSPPASLPPILEPELTNCTFYGNAAGSEGGALYLDGFVFDSTEMLSARVENSILHGNSAVLAGPQVFNTGENLVASSLVQGSGGSGGGWNAAIGTDGGDNLDGDPQFVSPADPDGADDVPGTSDDGLAVQATSPGVDAGNSAAPGLAGIASDFAGAARVQGAAVDLGAYEQAPVEPPCGPLPTGIHHADIGDTGGYAGSVCYDAGVYTIGASGSDVWGKRDGFHFVYRTLKGDGVVIARVDDIGGGNLLDLAGVMIRARLIDRSKHVLASVNGAGVVSFRERRRPGGLTFNRFGGVQPGPVWLKLIRIGHLFAGFKSSDGVHWHPIGIARVPMPRTVYVGIATSTPLAGTANSYEVSKLAIDGVSY